MNPVTLALGEVRREALRRNDPPLLCQLTVRLRPEQMERLREQLSRDTRRNVLLLGPDIEVRDLLRPMFTLTEENRTVQLLLACGAVVEGWMSRRFLGRATFWTWDPRFARISNFIVGETPRILPGAVEPVAWIETEGDEGE
jgi:hypothetical protein